MASLITTGAPKSTWRNGGMKFVRGENGRNPEKNPPKLRFVHLKPTWSDLDANSGPQRWETIV